MEHRDHMDNLGRLGPGDVQWMNAGSGVIHSEMPQQKEGRMRGFQLWINLPAAEKMTPASYQDIGAQDIPQYQMDHIEVRAIAGRLMVNEQEVTGAVTHPSTEPGYLDLQIASPDAVRILIPDGHNALLYVYEGSVTVGDHDYRLVAGKMGRLSHQGLLVLQAEPGTRVLVISGKPIGEPIVHYGPFVMNTMAEIKQAVTDYNSGKLV